MKSSNRVIQAEIAEAQVQPWAPIDFGQDSLITADLIRASAERLFGLKIGQTPEKNNNLIKASTKQSEVQNFEPADIRDSVNELYRSEPKSWAPFIEPPNPKKIAEEIIEKAKTRSEELIEQAEAQVEQVKKEAYDSGIESAKTEIRETLQAAVSVLNVAREWREDMMKQAEPMIMDLVKQMAQKMFGNGIVLEGDVLQQHFADVLETARSLEDIRIFMNPLDAKVLGPDWREYQASILGHKVEIVTNDSIKRGGCYIQGEWGTADALVETQLASILEQFSEVEKPQIEEE